MRILVTAPTGNVGTHVVRVLLAAGLRPRLLVRDPARLPVGVRSACDVRVGDLTRADDVRAAAEGIDAAFWLDTTPHTAEDPIAESAALGEVFAAARVPRAVFVSSSGAERGSGAGHLDGLAAIERALIGDVCVLRCGYFVTNLLADLPGDRLHGTRDPQEAFPWVAPRDIGEVAAARLLSDRWSGRVVQGVYGPRDLSFAQVAGILTDVLGHPVEYSPSSDDELRAMLAELPSKAVEAIVGMTAGTRGRPLDPPRGVESTTPTTLAEWAVATLR
ncbi:NAD(P)H-binding protein [Pseudonocardia sp. WMMC193]|uniref:NAD(P)H-binding protein n=1 Tax=Pseudonocardia sp. WMMC193 TaxID=2911965 RepID=UPI001F41B45D|nr:NAD(P)H-binding protein [Pseudonocardia sp. WMMC193]MCF7549915.1 NAD(P)H-binding protein [Pseudonocardia sp. WMMC193]